MQVYLVGGAVRDQLMGKSSVDTDYVVVGSSPEEMLNLGFTQVGADFPVFLHPDTKQEYALARTERKSGHGYGGFSVSFDTSVTIEQDLLRRDLTINAMAIEVKSLFDCTPITGDIVDPYNGLEDLSNKILKHVSDAFKEDPLRVLRVARFCSRYHQDGFFIDAKTLTMMQSIVVTGELQHLSAERIWQETQRAMMQDAPHIYWQVLKDIGAVSAIFYPLEQVLDEQNIWDMVAALLKLSVQRDLDLKQRWSLLCYGLLLKLQTDNLNINKTEVSRKEQQVAVLEKYDLLITSHTIPKSVNQFTKLFLGVCHKLQKVEQLTAEQLIELIQQTSAHKNIETLNNLMELANVVIFVHSKVRLQQALDAFQEISIKDIDETLKGKQIGDALTAKRVTQLNKKLFSL